jgi:alpha-methylacyl-CoA racemase
MSDTTAPRRGGPLRDLRVVEVAGIGPAPMGTMLLCDLGADVIRLDRPGGHTFSPIPHHLDILNRGRRSIVIDLKDDGDRATALDLIADADVLIEGFRPGVTERLGIGPDECLARNPRLVYARMTGWGQTGPLAERAGHDIDYVARTGALDTIGEGDGPPVIPVNYLGDFGGGGMYLAFGILAAVHHARVSGRGQVLDVAITDGTALLLTMLHSWRAAGAWTDHRESNLLDGGAHYYRVYATSDGRHLAVGALEPAFYAAFVAGLGVEIDGDWWTAHGDPARWPAMRERVAGIIVGRTLAEWIDVYEGTDACVAPVLTVAEAATDPHNVARETFLTVDGQLQAAPGPRFSATPAGPPGSPPTPGQHSAEIRDGLAAGDVWRHPRPAPAA